MMDDPADVIDHILFRGPYKVLSMQRRRPWPMTKNDMISDHPWHLAVLELDYPRPAVVSGVPERDHIDLFARGADDQLYFKHFDENGITNWQSYGGTLTSDPAAVVLGEGLIYIFVRGADGTLWYLWRAPGSAQPAAWRSEAGTFIGRPTVCMSRPDQLDVFVRVQDKSIKYNYYDGAWSGWIALDGEMASPPTATATEGVAWVFATGTDSTIYWMWVRGPNDHSNWQRLGGVETHFAPAVCSPDPSNHTIDVFARGPNDQVFHMRMENGLSGMWRLIEGELISEPTATAIRDSSWVFGIGTDGTIWHNFMTLYGIESEWQHVFGTPP
jgi:hypothetical protein